MTRHRPRTAARRRGSLASALLVLAGSGGLTTACSGRGDSEATPDDAASTGSSGRPSASASPYLPVPDGVELTPQGTELAVGDSAVVAYEPRQGLVGALEVTVTGLQRTTFATSFSGWQLSAATKRTAPYFVRAKVRNVGASDLGGRPVPLYAVDAQDTLVEASTFATRFKPCPSTPLPTKFGRDASATVCLVYLVPDRGDLAAVAFRPTEAFDPITWTGPVRQPASGSAGASGSASAGPSGSASAGTDR